MSRELIHIVGDDAKNLRALCDRLAAKGIGTTPAEMVAVAVHDLLAEHCDGIAADALRDYRHDIIALSMGGYDAAERSVGRS